MTPEQRQIRARLMEARGAVDRATVAVVNEPEWLDMTEVRELMDVVLRKFNNRLGLHTP